MLYTVEEYHRHVLADVDLRRSSQGVVPDKVSVALALASTAPSKAQVGFSELLGLLRDADACGCLTVYVDVYGRAVSYIVSAWCESDGTQSEPSIWMATDQVSEDMFVVDAVFTEGTLSQSIGLHLSVTSATRFTLYRPARPKRYRTYETDRIRRRRWPSSYVHERFSPSSHKHLAEAVRSSFVLFELAAKATAAMRVFEAEQAPCALNLSQTLPLVAGLLNLDQLQLAGGNEEEGMIAFALSNFADWKTTAVEHALARPLSGYTNGNDIIVLFGAGEPRATRDLLKRLLGRLTDEEEGDVFIRLGLFTRFRSTILAHYEEKGWRISCSETGDFVALSRVGE